MRPLGAASTSTSLLVQPRPALSAPPVGWAFNFAPTAAAAMDGSANCKTRACQNRRTTLGALASCSIFKRKTQKCNSVSENTDLALYKAVKPPPGRHSQAKVSTQTCVWESDLDKGVGITAVYTNNAPEV